MTIMSTRTVLVGGLDKPGKYGKMTTSRQKRPYVNAPFKSVKGFMPTEKIEAAYWAIRWADDADSSVFVNTARGTAYTRLMGKALPQAALLVNAAQGKQAWEMIANRSIQLVKALNNLRKGNLSGFARALLLDPATVRRKTTRQKAIKDPSGTWLEFTFGWVPLLEDIYKSVDILQRDFEPDPVRGSARVIENRTPSDFSTYRLTNMRTASVRLRANLRITNPNLLLANQLGLLNPAAVVWDVVPFSFVVDWFLPVGKFIKQFNDQAGISLDNPVTTIKVTSDVVYLQKPPYYYLGRGSASAVTRLTTPFVKPSFPKLRLPTASLWLAATSVALLTQVFRR